MTDRRRYHSVARNGCLLVVGLVLLSTALLANAHRAIAAKSPPVVPWLDQELKRAPAHPPLKPRCRAANLRAQLFLQGATGALVGGVTLTNRGPACALLGWPRVSLAGPAAKTTRWWVRRVASTGGASDPLADPPGSLRALGRGRSARVGVVWSNWCGPGSSPAGSSGQRPSALLLGLASRTIVRLPLARAPRCDAPSSPSKLLVAPFRPSVPQLPPGSGLSLRLTIVPRTSAANPLPARRGQLLRYRVAVTNAGHRPYRFGRSCPLYFEQLGGIPARAYVLNCHAAAVIGPGRSLLFAIALPVPVAAHLGGNELTFELAPRTSDPPVAQAQVRVVG
jgi:hypothetical protein